MKINLKDRLTCPNCKGDVFYRMMFQHLHINKDDLSKHQVFKLEQVNKKYIVCPGCNAGYLIEGDRLIPVESKLKPKPVVKSNLIIRPN